MGVEFGYMKEGIKVSEIEVKEKVVKFDLVYQEVVDKEEFYEFSGEYESFIMEFLKVDEGKKEIFLELFLI